MTLNKKKKKVAYLSMEFALDNSLSTYAGGLGILAGDYIKGAKDHDYPIIGIGIKWKQGYTDQRIDDEGKVYDTYHNYNYDFLKDTGVIVKVTIRNENVYCKVWKSDSFGNNPTYLLDTDIPQNNERWITGQLYGWFGEERIAQEMVLGIGGIKALRALGEEIDIFHFNEGHALFAAFELIREKMADGNTYGEAFKQTRQEIVFTTHTPVVQGNESHTIEKLMYMGANHGLTKEQMIDLGGSPFNMTVAGLHISNKANAVAQLHGETAKKMWAHVKNSAEIIAITNAIHKPTWVDQNMLEAAVSGINLWESHQDNKRQLIRFIEERNGVRFREDRLLIGFSRRAAPYKRSNLIFTNIEIIEPLIRDERIQLVFSGKAHPLDDTGKKMIENLVEMSKIYSNAVTFLQNYDMEIGAQLTRGSDVWLNNPRRPMEASGTSGMKAAMNGVLNLSILDGWWPEACEHGVNGWQFGDGFESDNAEEQDAHDLRGLYDVLINEVIHTYYNDKNRWIKMMQNSIHSTREKFAVKRMLEEYYANLY